MKVALSIVGLAISWALYHWLPQSFAELIKVAGFPAGLAAAVAVLNAGWGFALPRLTALEKLDDLTTDQREVAIRKWRELRTSIIKTMQINGVLLVVSIGVIFLANIASFTPYFASWIGYGLCFCIGFWLGGSVESWHCLNTIEESRISLVEAQAIQKQRTAYLAKIRSDEAASPISRNDPHLNKYTEDYKHC